jgi:hypothetical protein
MGRLLKDPDSSARLRLGAERVLRHAVESRQIGRDEHHSVLRTLRSLCRAARSHDLHVEQLVVIFKDTWRTLPEARALTPESGTELLKGVISHCIDEFYRTDGAAFGATQPSDSVAVPDSSLSFMLGPLS